MLSLYIIRHAKALQNQPGVEDVDRPLEPFGRAEASEIGEYMRRLGLAPQAILGSSARRARETLGLLLPHLDGDVAIHVDSALYLASAEQLVARLNRLDVPALRVMMIAHNPGIARFATMLANDGDSEDLERLNSSFPTAALAEISFDLEKWSDVQKGTGRLVRLIVPVGDGVAN
jgi:phosphohistidine phosphatase